MSKETKQKTKLNELEEELALEFTELQVAETTEEICDAIKPYTEKIQDYGNHNMGIKILRLIYSILKANIIIEKMEEKPFGEVTTKELFDLFKKIKGEKFTIKELIQDLIKEIKKQEILKEV